MNGSIKRQLYSLFPLLFLAVGILTVLLSGDRERRELIKEREGRFSEILQLTELQFTSFRQLLDTMASLSDELPHTRSAHEIFLNKIFASSRTELLYGLGIWYEPDRFQEGVRWFGPYIHFDRPSGGTYSLTYDWSTPEYDYLNQDWYGILSRTSPDSLGITPPYYDKDYTYLTFGRPFYREGELQGVVTIDIILLRLAYYMDSLDTEGFTEICLTDREGRVLYGSDRNAPPAEGKGIRVFHRESRVLPLSLYAAVGEKDLIREMDRTRLLFLIMTVLWLFSLVLSLVLASGRSPYRRNLLLSRENRELRHEIERRRKAEEQLHFLAYHDPLTKLENFRALVENVPPPRGEMDDRQLMQLSLENIGELSSLMERDFIDNLLIGFTEKLRESTGSEVSLYRGRGFSFYLICPEESRDSSGEMADRIIRIFRNTVRFSGREVRLRIRIGLTPFSAGETMEQLVSRSQLALTGRERAESSGIGGIVRYDSELNRIRTERLELDADMDSPEFLRELSVHYQPIMDIRTGRPAGYEALARWQNRKRGRPIRPDEFIPLAEENGHIIDLGWFVLEEVLKTLRDRVKKSGPYITVNVSPVQFIESDFVEKLDALLARYAVDRERLKLEITETSASGQIRFFWSAVEKLVRAGYRLVMDDFGTGESSLGRLQSIPFDTLKLDKFFLRNMKDDRRQTEIIRSFVSLSDALDMTLVAEGVEDGEDLRLIHALDISYVQGFLYSPPRTWEELEKMGLT